MSKKKTASSKAKTKPVANQSTLIEDTTCISDALQEDSDVVIETEETPELLVALEHTDEPVDVIVETDLEIIHEPELIQFESIEDTITAEEVIAENHEEIIHDGNVVAEEVIENIAQKKTSKKKANTEGVSSERINLVGSSYHYFRNWLKRLFRDNEIQSAKFLKNPEGWNGQISILVSEKEQAIEVLDKYRESNPDTKALWWDISAN